MAPRNNNKRQQSPERAHLSVVETANNKMENFGMINLLPTFNGKKDEDIDFFLTQFENIADMANWPDKNRTVILKTRLKDKAYIFLTQKTELQKSENMEEIKSLLKKQFKVSLTVLQKQNNFNKIKMQPGMSISELALEITKATNEILGDNDTQEILEIKNNMRLAKFTEALRSDLAFEVKKMNIQRFDKAVEYAEHLETIYGDNESTEINYVNQNEKRGNPQTTKNKCIGCGLSNHVWEECRYNPSNVVKNKIKQDSQSDKFCIGCNKSGHFFSTCWHNPNPQNNYEGNNYRNSRSNVRNDQNRGFREINMDINGRQVNDNFESQTFRQRNRSQSRNRRALN